MNISNKVWHNGRIISIDIKGAEHEYEAMAVSGEKIIQLGTYEEMAEIIDEGTEIIDLEGKSILPGLSDAHLHASMSSEMLFDFSLHDTEPAFGDSRDGYIKKYQEKIKAYQENHPNTEIIRGVGWNPVLFTGDKEGLPKAADIDKVCSDIPVILRSFDHHSLWVNTKALEMAEITKETPDPRNGIVSRDINGNPTGVFQETTAMDLLIRNLPGADYTVEEYKQGILFYQNHFGDKYGETLVFDAYCSENAIKAYEELDAEEKLTMRVRTAYYADPSLPVNQFDGIIAKKEKFVSGENFAIKTVKFFIDGSGLTFYLNEPFEKKWLEEINIQPGYRGYSQWTQKELNEIFLKLDNAGFQIHIHCMADGAVKMAVAAFEYVARFNDLSENRHTITHIMLADDDDLKKMGELGIIAAVQPMWAIADGLSEYSGIAMLGKERVSSFYRFGTMKKYGCRITCGTDFPVTNPPSPFLGMQTGITRQISKPHPEYELYKGKVLGAEKEKLSLTDLIEGYCISGAYQCFLEEITGSLEIGKSADFVILDKDIKSVPSDEIMNIKVTSKYFKGRKVYEL